MTRPTHSNPASPEGTSPFKALTREATLSARVTTQVEHLLEDSHLQPGDRLPAERELATRFGVSRTVIREAVRALVARGMLDVRQGSGTTVRTPSVEALTRPMTLLLKGGQAEIDHEKVTEVRRLLEVEIAGLAAERRTETDLAALHRALHPVDHLRVDREAFVAWDVAFHSALAVATHNDLFLLLLDSVVATMRKVREVGFDVRGTPERALRHHAAILEQVRRGSVSGARHAMAEHLAEAERTMTRALKLRGRPASPYSR